MAEQNRTPVAIALAGLFIGAGLFFGLRDRRSPDSPPSGTSYPGVPSPVASTPVWSPQAVARAPQAAPQASREKVAQQATQAIEAHRAMLVEKCWKPFAQKPDKLKPAGWIFNISFDAEGNQIIRGVAEERGTGHPDVTACVTQNLPLLKIPPPGANAYVEVPFHLP